MQPLSTLRTRWTEIDAEETRLLREMTIPERLRAFAILYDAFAPRLHGDPAYWAEHEATLIERQSRLQRLAQWLKAQSE